MNLPNVYFDDCGGIAVRGQFQDNGDWVTYAVKIELLDYLHLLGWIRNVLCYEKFILSKPVENWLISEVKKSHPDDIRLKLEEEFAKWSD